MTLIERRIALLETAQGKQGLFDKPEMNALIADLWRQAGTSYAEQVAKYGSEHAMLTALDADIQSIQSSRIINLEELKNVNY